MKYKLVRHTSVAAFLSINIRVEREGQVRLLTWPLLPLTTWVWWWWQAQGLRDHLAVELDQRLAGLRERWSVWLTVTGIGLHSILFGLGMTG